MVAIRRGLRARCAAFEPGRTATSTRAASRARCAVGDLLGRFRTLYFANTRLEAAEIGFDDEFIYKEVPLAPEARSIPGIHMRTPQSHVPFAEWAAKSEVLLLDCRSKRFARESALPVCAHRWHPLWGRGDRRDRTLLGELAAAVLIRRRIELIAVRLALLVLRASSSGESAAGWGSKTLLNLLNTLLPELQPATRTAKPIANTLPKPSAISPVPV